MPTIVPWKHLNSAARFDGETVFGASSRNSRLCGTGIKNIFYNKESKGFFYKYENNY